MSRKYRLISTRTGKEIKINDEVMTFRKERAIVRGIQPPERAGTTGRVILEYVGKKGDFVLYPGVIDAEITY